MQDDRRVQDRRTGGERRKTLHAGTDRRKGDRRAPAQAPA